MVASDNSADGLPVGDEAALNELAEQLYPELQRLARGALGREGAGHTLQTTALVNEAYLRLAGSDFAVESRAHFLALAARLMRRVLIDHARGKNRLKRGGDQIRVSLTWARKELSDEEATTEILALDGAMKALHAFDPRRAQLIELQLFGGMTYPEMAEAMEISEATVHRDLRLARAWLQRELADGS